jgi:hypothetical protein
MKTVKTFREMLTLGRIRGMYNEDKFASLSEQELRVVQEWLYVLQTREIDVMARDVARALLRTE